MKNKLKQFHVLLLLLIISCNNKENKALDFQLKPVTIKGKIENYNSTSKTGLLRHFDAVTRSHKTDVFAFDSSGFFEIKFDILHEGLGYTILEIQDNRYSIYVEPQKEYNIQITSGQLKITEPQDDINNEIISFEDALGQELGSEISKAQHAHNDDLSIEEYVQIQKEVENKKLAFLNSYLDIHELSNKTINVLKNKFRYTTANAWINIRYDYSKGSPVLRDSLPDDFYQKLFSAYPINSTDAYNVIEYTYYLSNIGDVFDKTKSMSTTKRIDFYRQFNVFSEDELNLLTAAYERNKTIMNSEEFKQFAGDKDKMMDEYKVRKRYRMHSIIENCSELPKGMGRDFVLSLAISKHYFEKDYSPTENEWIKLDELFSQKPIIKYLRSISPPEKKIIVEETSRTIKNPTEEFTKITVDKYLKKHVGKVIYIDFWATWCAPCKNQIPYAKLLHAELEGKNVAFINFCVRSEMDTWKNLIEKEQISGENYLLNKDEYNVLTQYFKVKSFPTYILIGKGGNIKSYSAPRPSAKSEIIKEINALL